MTFEGGDNRNPDSMGTEYLKDRPVMDFDMTPTDINGSIVKTEHPLSRQTSIAPDAEPNDLGEGIAQLQKYKEIFEDLTDKHHIVTGEGLAVIEVIVTYDAKSAISITRDEN